MSGATPRGIRHLGSAMGARGVAALAAAVLAVIVLAASAKSVVGSAVIPGATEIDEHLVDEARAEKFQQSFENQVAQVTGRSMFFVPPEPPAPDEVREQRPVERAPSEPSKPTRYGGPKIIAMVNGKVWFDDGRRLDVGGESDGDLKVISTRSPWSARLEWKGVEFDVELFARTTDEFLEAESKE